MGHCTPKTAGPRAGTAVAVAEKPAGGTPFPVVDYGYGKDPMAGMDHSKMKGMMNMPVLGKEGDTDHRLHRKNARLQRDAQIVAELRNASAIDR